ncbi:30S ribosomal protein S19e [Candidatus Woesearchaeota archaeon]|nr:30S ribosomal protein S19e [Candidatus Woesearchaeota archaeon]
MLLYDTNPSKVISKVKDTLKEIPTMQKPEWAVFVKTGSNKERAPLNADWWYFRAASVLRKVAIDGPIGVSKLRIKYGSRKRLGHAGSHFRKASGKIIRVILQQLETSGLIEKAEKGVHKGRVASPKGVSILDKAVIAVKKESKEEKPEEPIAKVEEEQPKETKKPKAKKQKEASQDGNK